MNVILTAGEIGLAIALFIVLVCGGIRLGKSILGGELIADLKRWKDNL